jgi:hypothetical protein
MYRLPPTRHSETYGVLVPLAAVAIDVIGTWPPQRVRQPAGRV